MTIAEKLATIAANEQRVYDAGYEQGKVDYGIDWSDLTDWRYFNFGNSRKSIVLNLKPEDTRNGTDFSYMFNSCGNMTDVFPNIHLDTSNGTNFSGMFSSCKYTRKWPEIDTSKGTSFSAMFANSNDISNIPVYNTSNGTNFSRMFSYCTYTSTFPLIDTSKGTNFSEMFSGCSSTKTFPNLNTSNGTNFYCMFHTCSNMTSSPDIDTSKGTNFSNMFTNCSKLTTVSRINLSSATNVQSTFWISSITSINLEGTIKVSGLSLSICNLDYESLKKFVNALIDYSGSTSTYKITFGSTNLAKLTEEDKAEMTNKGWTYS